jgi:hypothetical protein
VRRAAFEVASQTRLHYADSALSEGSAGDISGGDRLPWADSIDNFEPLASFDWQVHVYGEALPGLREAAERAGIPVRNFAWSDDLAASGLERNAMYLVRPDGYVGLAQSRQDAGALEDYVRRHTIRPRFL